MPNGIYAKIRSAVGKFADAGAHLDATKAAEVIGKKLGLSESMIQYTHIELRNSVFEPEFKKVPYNQRIVFLPHCTRDIKVCQAVVDGEGIHCKNCGGCGIDEVTKLAKELGYMGVFTAHGGSMVKKIITKYNPKAVVGVCCFPEAIMGIEGVKSLGKIPQAVLLLNDGCQNTVMNFPLLKEKMVLIDKTLIINEKKSRAKQKKS